MKDIVDQDTYSHSSDTSRRSRRTHRSRGRHLRIAVASARHSIRSISARASERAIIPGPDDDSLSIVLESTPCLLSKASTLGGMIGGDVTVGPASEDESEVGGDPEIGPRLDPPHVITVEVLWKVRWEMLGRLATLTKLHCRLWWRQLFQW